MLKLTMDKRTSGDQVADTLRAEILSGRIPDGRELNQVEIAESLGLSRMPVREALNQLENEGLIERLDNRHTRVLGLSPSSAAARLRMLSDMEARTLADLPADCAEQLRALPVCSAEDHIALHNAAFDLSADRFARQLYRRLFSKPLAWMIRAAAERLPDARALAHAAGCKSADTARPHLAAYYRALAKEKDEC